MTRHGASSVRGVQPGAAIEHAPGTHFEVAERLSRSRTTDGSRATARLPVPLRSPSGAEVLSSKTVAKCFSTSLATLIATAR